VAGWPDPAWPVEAHQKTILPPKIPPGSQPTSADANRRPPSADTLARFPQLAGPLTCSYHGQTPPKGSPVRYRKTAMTCEPPYEPPLRNRTVDRLLTIDNQHVPVTAAAALTWPFVSTHELTPAQTSARWLNSAPRSAPQPRLCTL
jgi:hypothetical protein